MVESIPLFLKKRDLFCCKGGHSELLPFYLESARYFRAAFSVPWLHLACSVFFPRKSTFLPVLTSAFPLLCKGLSSVEEALAEVQYKAKTCILLVPHGKVGSPHVIVEIAMDAPGQIWLLVWKI